jgi:hypothetical protein
MEHSAAAAQTRPSEASRNGEPYITLSVLSPDGVKTPLKVKASDDVSTLRALITQMCVASRHDLVLEWIITQSYMLHSSFFFLHFCVLHDTINLFGLAMSSLLHHRAQAYTAQRFLRNVLPFTLYTSYPLGIPYFPGSIMTVVLLLRNRSYGRRFDTSEWTQVSDRREDRVSYSDWTDEDTGFSEVIALENKAPSQTQQSNFDWRRPRTWLEWTDKRGKLRCLIIFQLTDSHFICFYHICLLQRLQRCVRNCDGLWIFCC